MNLAKTIAIALLFALTVAVPALAGTRGSLTFALSAGEGGQTEVHRAVIVQASWEGEEHTPRQESGSVRLTLQRGGINPVDLASLRDNRTRIPSLELTVGSGDSSTAYLKYKLDRCFIKSWSTSGDADVIVVEYAALQTGN